MGRSRETPPPGKVMSWFLDLSVVGIMGSMQVAGIGEGGCLAPQGRSDVDFSVIPALSDVQLTLFNVGQP